MEGVIILIRDSVRDRIGGSVLQIGLGEAVLSELPFTSETLSSSQLFSLIVCCWDSGLVW